MGSKAIKMKDKEGNIIYPCPYYPVGSIYMSVNDTNPANFFGGTWVQIKDKFLLACGSTYNNGTTGGSATHSTSYTPVGTNSGTAISVDQMPSHSHGITKNFPYGIPYNNTSGASANNGGNVFYGESYNPFTIQNTGGGKTHTHTFNGTKATISLDTMPPYLAVYVWKRTA